MVPSTGFVMRCWPFRRVPPCCVSFGNAGLSDGRQFIQSRLFPPCIQKFGGKSGGKILLETSVAWRLKNGRPAIVSPALAMYSTEDGTFIARNPARHDAAAPASAAAEPLDESRYRGIRFQAVSGERLLAQDALAPAMQASDQHDEIGGPHDQSSSDSRVTAGPFGFLTLSQ